MIYPFECPACKAYVEIYRLMKNCSDPEPCPTCGTDMVRIYTVPNVQVPAYDYFDHGLGVYVHGKKDIRERIKQLGGEKITRVKNAQTGEIETHHHEGMSIVEVGTENQKKHIKYQRKEYAIPREILEKADFGQPD